MSRKKPLHLLYSSYKSGPEQLYPFIREAISEVAKTCQAVSCCQTLYWGVQRLPRNDLKVAHCKASSNHELEVPEMTKKPWTSKPSVVTVEDRGSLVYVVKVSC